jgi:hypothetical protein
MAVTLFYLPEARMQGDVDNIVKLTIDALKAHIYIDDAQVERILVQKFEPGNIFEFSNPTPAFVQAVTGPRPVLYIRVSNNPVEELR